MRIAENRMSDHDILSDAEREALSAVMLEPDLPPQRVLIVDDDKDSRDLLAQILDLEGICCVTADSGEAALKVSFLPELEALAGRRARADQGGRLQGRRRQGRLQVLHGHLPARLHGLRRLHARLPGRRADDAAAREPGRSAARVRLHGRQGR